MKAKLIISIDDEQFQETDIELAEKPDRNIEKPDMIAYWFETRSEINEKRVRREISKAINNSPLKFANAYFWDAVLVVGSRMNEMVEVIS